MTTLAPTYYRYLQLLLCGLALAAMPACGSSSHAPPVDGGTDAASDHGKTPDMGHVSCSGACPAGRYQLEPCTSTADRVCASCTAIENCVAEVCTSVADQTCTTCAAGFYAKDGACVACSSSCGAGRYQTAACTATADLACADCTAIANCPAETCTTASDQTCTSCGANYFSSGGTCHACTTACGAGQYQTGACTATSDITCASCAPIDNCTAQQCTGASDATCTQCATGLYLDGGTCHQCSGACPVGEQSSAACTPTTDRACTSCTIIANCTLETCTTTTDQTCQSCAGGNYLSSGNTQCTACAAGSFSAGGSVTSCSACAAGTYAASAGATSCLTCPAGTYSGPGATACVPCAAGSYSALAGASSCTVCATGSYAMDPGATSCSSFNSCTAGQYVSVPGSATANRTCAACPAGQLSTTSNAGSCTAWTTCNAGQSVSTAGTATTDRTCAACGAGQFSATSNAGSCAAWTTCDAGQSVTAPGSATADRTCAACAAGQFSTTSNAASCTAWTTCNAGQSVTIAGSATADRTCAACGAGQFSTTSNAVSCTAWTTCNAGQRVSTAGSATADRTCAACVAGQFSTSSNAINCTAWKTCNAGQYVSVAGTATTDRTCAACAGGTFSTGANAGSCSTCATCGAGQYQVFDCSATTNRSCASCDSTCATCSGAGPSSCLTCAPGGTLTGGSCSYPSDCYAILQAGQATGDGLYNILAGGTIVRVFCDMANGGFTLLNDQDTAQGYLSSDTWRAGVSATAPNGGQWGILNLASSFQNAGGGFEFRMTFGQSQAQYLHWYQTGDPSTGTRGTLSGVTMSPANQIGCGEFDGLADDGQGESAWDANIGGCWWFAVGSSGSFGPGGIPAYEASDEGQLITDRVRLWVRKNGPAHLAAWYPLDEGSGSTLKDITAAGNNASLASGAWASGAACHSGACITMSGSDSASASNTGIISFGTASFSATAWVKTTSTGGEEVLIGNNICGVPAGWLLSMSGGRPEFATFGSGSSNGYIRSPSAVNDGQWHLVAGVRTPTSTALYVDGARVATGSVSASYSSDTGSADLQIGNLDACPRGFNGSLDDIRLYAGALTQTEISALAQTQSCAARLGCGGATPNCAVTVGSPVYGQMVGTLPTIDHSGLSGGALSFAFSDNLTFSNSSIPIAGAARSMSFWMKSTQNAPGCMVNYGIFSMGQRFGVLISSDDDYFVGESVDLPGVNEIDDGSWHHVLVTYDGTTLTLYRDGLFEAQADLVLNTGSSDVFLGMAVAGHSDEFYVGQLDDLRFYDRALSSSEAALVYSGDVSMKTNTSGLAAWYLLNGDGSEEAQRCAP